MEATDDGWSGVEWRWRWRRKRRWRIWIGEANHACLRPLTLAALALARAPADARSRRLPARRSSVSSGSTSRPSAPSSSTAVCLAAVS